MSRLMRCNRCGSEQEIPEKVNPLQDRTVSNPNEELANWSRVSLTRRARLEGVQGEYKVYDLCEDCREIFLLQFMTGAAIAPITQPLAQTMFTHQPMTDCQWVYDPQTGRLHCYHDGPDRYKWLITNQAQNVAEGVPPQALSGGEVHQQGPSIPRPRGFGGVEEED